MALPSQFCRKPYANNHNHMFLLPTKIQLRAKVHVKISILTTKPASVIWITIGSDYLTPLYVGPHLGPIQNSNFWNVFFKESNVLSFIFSFIMMAAENRFTVSIRRHGWICLALLNVGFAEGSDI